VNDRVQLAHAAAVLNRRLLETHMRAGVSVLDPATTWVDVDVVLEADVELLPGSHLHGRTFVGRGAVVGPQANLTDTVVRAGASVQTSTCVGAYVGEGATVGPYSYLRPGTRLGRRTKVGAYVEVKASVIGEDTKVPHLSYVGDAVVGQRSNIGAATVTCNYDGVDKHRTTIGDDVFIGSDTMLVAPVTVGDGAATGAGAVVREDVPPGALAVSDNTQHNVEGWAVRRGGEKEQP
jgi:bifunctional UDP-N-acetylglucosamine pyrophosphorylase/glucosamine-1-phosphate N-acetyltransferase